MGEFGADPRRFRQAAAGRMAARFEPPVISDNPTGWGPSTIPAQFKDMVSLYPSIPLSCYTSPLTP